MAIIFGYARVSTRGATRSWLLASMPGTCGSRPRPGDGTTVRSWPTEEEFVQQPVGRSPWGHVTVLLDGLKSREERDWYAARAVEYGWSRAVLEHQIKADLRGAIGAAPTNFTAALEASDSELAQQLVKDP